MPCALCWALPAPKPMIYVNVGRGRGALTCGAMGLSEACRIACRAGQRRGNGVTQVGEESEESSTEAAREPPTALKALVAFGTTQGTTARIGEAIAEGMKSAGAEAAAMPLDLLAMMPKRIEEVEILGIGAPVYYLREPDYMTDFIADLPPLDGKKAFVYCACGMNRVGETLQRLQALLSARGAVVVGAQHFSSAMSYPPYRKRKLGNPQDLPDESVLAAARGFGLRMAEAPHLAPLPPNPVSLGTRLKARLLASRGFRQLAFPAIEVKHDACTGYGSCISRCPFRGLEREDGEDIPYVTDACIQCLQCVDFCPRGAIAEDAPLKQWVSVLSYHLGLH